MCVHIYTPCRVYIYILRHVVCRSNEHRGKLYKRKKIYVTSPCIVLPFSLLLSWRLIFSNASKFSVKKKLKKKQASSFSRHYYKHVLRLNEIFHLSSSLSPFLFLSLPSPLSLSLSHSLSLFHSFLSFSLCVSILSFFLSISVFFFIRL